MSICNCGSCTSSTCPRSQVTGPSPNGTAMFIFGLLLVDVVMICFGASWLYISDLKNQIAVLSISNTTVSTCEVPDHHELVAPRRELYGEGSRVYDITHRFQPDLLTWEKKLYRNFDVGLDVDTLDLATLNGPALLVDVPRHMNITAKVMMSLNIPKGVKRVLFRTLNTARHLMWKREFDKSYVGFMKDGAKWLVDNTDIKLVGIDYLSAAAYDELFTAHNAFLEDREIIVVGALKLDNIDAGEYNVHCLPLKLVRTEGSPIRCTLMK